MQESDIRELVAAVVARLTAEGALGGMRSVSAGTGSVAPADSGVAVGRVAGSAISDSEPLPDMTLPEFRRQSGVQAAHKPEVLEQLQRSTGARVGVGKVGVRPTTGAYLRFLADHARSKGTVFREVPTEWLDKNNLWSLRSRATDKNEYLTRPDLGRLLDPEGLAELQRRRQIPCQVQVVLSDGLSTDALLGNYEEILPPLQKGLASAGLTVGDPFFLHYGRVKAQDAIGETLGCDVVLLLIGERPGLGQSESMSCYAVYRPTSTTVESQRTVISNIHRGGLPPVEAAAVIVELALDMLKYQASGIELNRKKAQG